jgi:hypothetical protein
MGIQFHPGSASWSYGGFDRFRTALAAEEGLVLDEMVGFGGTREWETSDGKQITVLAALLNHSDCDGFLTARDCALIWPRLAEILDHWDSNEDKLTWAEYLTWDEYHYDVKQGRQLVEAMQYCASHGCPLEFR